MFLKRQHMLSRNIIKTTLLICIFSLSKNSKGANNHRDFQYQVLITIQKDTLPAPQLQPFQNIKFLDSLNRIYTFSARGSAIFKLLVIWNNNHHIEKSAIKDLNALSNYYKNLLQYMTVYVGFDKPRTWKRITLNFNKKWMHLKSVDSNLLKEVKEKCLPIYILFENDKVLQTFTDVKTLKDQLNNFYFQYDNLIEKPFNKK